MWCDSPDTGNPMKRPPQIAISDSDWQRTPTAVEALVVRSLTVPWPATTPESYRRFVSARRFHLCYGHAVRRRQDGGHCSNRPRPRADSCGPSRTGRGGADQQRIMGISFQPTAGWKSSSAMAWRRHPLDPGRWNEPARLPLGQGRERVLPGASVLAGEKLTLPSPAPRRANRDERQLISGRATAHAGDARHQHAGRLAQRSVPLLCRARFRGISQRTWTGPV